MEVITFDDAAAFVARVSPLLLAHEAHNNLILGICVELARNARTYGQEPPVLRAVVEAGAPALAALQTPPHKLVLSHAGRPGAAEALAAALLREGLELPGVLGPRPVAEAFAAGWAAGGGPPATPGMDQRIYQLTAVRPPPAPPGRMRRATAGDRPLLEAWFAAFSAEATPGSAEGDVAAVVTRWLSSESRQLVLWEDGEAAAMAGAAGPTPQGIRIGAVYTPPGRRRRGYASALVAALSQAQLDAGRRYCFLYTDLGNPTSNHIYQAIGYEPVVDIAELRFQAGSG